MTKIRGTNQQEYEIYVAAAESLGWTVKTFDQWLSGEENDDPMDDVNYVGHPMHY